MTATPERKDQKAPRFQPIQAGPERIRTLKDRILRLEAELERKDRQIDDLSTRLTQQTMRVRELTPIRARLQFYERSRLGVRPEPLALLIDDPSGDDVAPDATPEDRRRLNK